MSLSGILGGVLGGSGFGVSACELLTIEDPKPKKLRNLVGISLSA